MDFDETNAKVFTNLRMLELDKNKVEIELGNRNGVVIQENFDATYFYQNVGVISSFLEEHRSESFSKVGGGPTPMGTVPVRYFKSWASANIDSLKKYKDLCD